MAARENAYYTTKAHWKDFYTSVFQPATIQLMIRDISSFATDCLAWVALTGVALTKFMCRIQKNTKTHKQLPLSTYKMHPHHHQSIRIGRLNHSPFDTSNIQVMTMQHLTQTGAHCVHFQFVR